MQYAKAVIAALVAGLGALGTALLDNAVAPVEWVGIASTTLIALYGVWQVPNAKPPAVVQRAELGERLVGGHVTVRPAPTTRATGTPRVRDSGGSTAPPD